MNHKLPKIGTRYGGWRRTGVLQLEVEQGHMLPFWYGVAWLNPMNGTAACYPIPLNWIFWTVREIYWKLKSTRNLYNHPMYEAGHSIGYKLGDRDGFLRGYNEALYDIKYRPMGEVLFSKESIMASLHKNTSKSST